MIIKNIIIINDKLIIKRDILAKNNKELKALLVLFKVIRTLIIDFLSIINDFMILLIILFIYYYIIDLFFYNLIIINKFYNYLINLLN